MTQIIKTITNKITNLKLKGLLMSLLILISFYSCEEFQLPETGSIADKTPPEANFSAEVSLTGVDSWKVYTFSNKSSSATQYAWDFGDGNTSTEFEPTNTYAAEGTYTVTLTAKDKLGVTSVFTSDVEVVKPLVIPAIVPVVLNPSFDEPGTNGKYTTPWVDSNLGKTIQISTSSSFVGNKSSKYPNANTDPRVAYQKDIAVTPNTDYVITYYYSIETGNPSTITLAVLGGTVTSPSEVAAATLSSHTGTTQAGKSTFEKVDLEFNSGNNNTISIHISNTGEKTAYLEEISTKVK